MMISVALATCNGERYLAEQLQSLATQQRLPDELIVCDDASDDYTVLIVKEFTERAPFPVTLHTHSSRAGITGNFARILSLCQGHVIALCDQDDLWEPRKLARIEQAFHEHPTAGAVCSDAMLIDADGRSLQRQLWANLGITRRERRRLAQGQGLRTLTPRNIVTGATLAFRTQYLPYIQPIPSSWLHDAWIALIVAAFSPIVPIPEPLIRYRQHSEQQIGAAKRGLGSLYRAARLTSADSLNDQAVRFRELQDRLLAVSPQQHEAIAIVQEKIAHLHARADLRASTWRTPRVLRELARGRYARYSRGWSAALQDLLM